MRRTPDIVMLLFDTWVGCYDLPLQRLLTLYARGRRWQELHVSHPSFGGLHSVQHKTFEGRFL
jgi:hypothetical protein